MNMPVITTVASYVPPIIPSERRRTLETTQRRPTPSGWNAWITSWHSDYGPCLEERTMVRASRARRVPVERDMDLSGLAAKVAQTICTARRPNATPIDIVMFCHSSLNEHVSTTTAGRLRAVVGSPCFPFSVSQQHGASTFSALQLTRDLLIAEPKIHTILIVAAEKWCSPLSRWTDLGITLGDAAGALLVERSTAASRGLELIDARVHRIHGFATRLPLTLADVRTSWATALLPTLDAILSKQNLRHDDLGLVVGQDIDPQLDNLVFRHLHRRATGNSRHCRVHLGTAEPIVQLANTLESHKLPLQNRIISWGVGLSGYVGCALFTSRGQPLLYRDVNSRDLL